MSAPRSASNVGPSKMHTLIATVTPTSEPAWRTSRSAALMTSRSAPSVRLMCVYHWYLVRLVRIACCGFGIVGLLEGTAAVVETHTIGGVERDEHGRAGWGYRRRDGERAAQRQEVHALGVGGWHLRHGDRDQQRRPADRRLRGDGFVGGDRRLVRAACDSVHPVRDDRRAGGRQVEST